MASVTFDDIFSFIFRPYKLGSFQLLFVFGLSMCLYIHTHIPKCIYSFSNTYPPGYHYKKKKLEREEPKCSADQQHSDIIILLGYVLPKTFPSGPTSYCETKLDANPVEISFPQLSLSRHKWDTPI